MKGPRADRPAGTGRRRRRAAPTMTRATRGLMRAEARPAADPSAPPPAPPSLGQTSRRGRPVQRPPARARRDSGSAANRRRSRASAGGCVRARAGPADASVAWRSRCLAGMLSRRPGCRSPGSTSPAGRARLAFGAPLPAHAAGDAELADLWLLERLPAWQVREALRPSPARRIRRGSTRRTSGWARRPARAGRRAPTGGSSSAAVRRSGPGRPGVDARDSRGAAARGSIAPSNQAQGRRGEALRPAAVARRLSPPGRGPPVALAARTRIEPELGSGRPEEVVAALAEAAGVDLEIHALVRTRLLFADDLHATEADAG